jgi:glycine oxidase
LPAGARLLEAGEVHREEPQANPRAKAAILTPDEAYVDPQRLTVALAEAARRLGVTVQTRASLTGFQRSPGRLRGVRTSEASYPADDVLLAAGPWTQALARRLGANVPVRPVRGQMLSLEGPAQPLRHMVWGSDAYLLPREDGQTYVGASVEEAGYRKHTTTLVLNRLRRAALALVPGLAAAKQTRAWAGLRPGTPDAMPILGLLPGWQNVWVATGHFRNGILLAPGSAALIAESVIAGRPDAKLEPFSPRRFAE